MTGLLRVDHAWSQKVSVDNQLRAALEQTFLLPGAGALGEPGEAHRA